MLFDYLVPWRDNAWIPYQPWMLLESGKCLKRPTTWFVKPCPERSSWFIGRLSNSALQSNTTHIFFLACLSGKHNDVECTRFFPKVTYQTFWHIRRSFTKFLESWKNLLSLKNLLLTHFSLLDAWILLFGITRFSSWNGKGTTQWSSFFTVRFSKICRNFWFSTDT